MPYLGSTVFFVVLTLALLVSMTGYFLLARALWPRFVGRAEEVFAARPGRSLLVGVPVATALFTLCALLLNAPNGALRLLGFAFSAASLGFTLAGMAGIAGRVGRGLASPGDDAAPWRRTLRAGIVLELSMLVPILGWFLVLPLSVLGGAGVAILALRDPNRTRATLPAPSPSQFFGPASHPHPSHTHPYAHSPSPSPSLSQTAQYPYGSPQ